MDSFYHIPQTVNVGIDLKVCIKFSESSPNLAYVFIPDQKKGRFYSVDCKSIFENGASDLQIINVYLLPGNPIDVFSCFNLDLVLSDVGAIYSIPKSNSSSLDKNKTFSTIVINDSQKIFEERKCKAACSIGSAYLALLLCDYVGDWSLSLHQLSSNGILKRSKLIETIHRSTKIPNSRPIIAAFLIDTIRSSFAERLEIDQSQGRSNSDTLDSWIVILCIGDGKIISCRFNKSRQHSLTFLFCFHQEILNISTITFEQGGTNKTGLCFVGALGKIFAAISLNGNDGAMHEFYVPGPIRCWSECNGSVLHSSNSSLWHSNCGIKVDGTHSSPTITFKQICKDSVLAIALSSHTGNEQRVLLCTETGNLLIFKLNEFLNHNKSYLKKIPKNRSEILQTIVESSVKMRDIYQLQTHHKKALEELSCASNLKFNRSLRQTFNLLLTTNWIRESPHEIDICINVKNAGNFSVIGGLWRLIVRTLSKGICRTTSALLKNGIEIGKSVNVIMRLNFFDIISQEIFPIQINCDLFFSYENELENNERRSLPNNLNSSIAFMIELAEWKINELYYLHSTSNDEQSKMKQNFTNALWEMAEKRLDLGFFGQIKFKKGFRLNRIDKPTELSITAKNSWLSNIVERKEEEDICFLTLRYLVKNSRAIKLCRDSNEIICSIFGVNLTLKIEPNKKKTSKVTIASPSPILLMKIKRAVIQRLKTKDLGNLGKDLVSERFQVSSGMKKKLKDFEDMIKDIDIYQGLQKQQIQCLYRHLRENLSIEFPLTC